MITVGPITIRYGKWCVEAAKCDHWELMWMRPLKFRYINWQKGN